MIQLTQAQYDELIAAQKEYDVLRKRIAKIHSELTLNAIIALTNASSEIDKISNLCDPDFKGDPL